MVHSVVFQSIPSVCVQLTLQPSLAAPQAWALTVLQHRCVDTLQHLDEYTLLSRYIDGQAANGETALHMATVFGNIACIKVLLAAGASMAVRTTSPVTATSNVLGMSGAIIFQRGSTSLHYAAQCNRTTIIRLMLKVLIKQNSNHFCTTFGALGSIAPAQLLFISDELEHLQMQKYYRNISQVQVCFLQKSCMHLQANADFSNGLQLPYCINGWHPLITPCALDVRKITDERNQLAYHLARQGSFCYASILLDPRVSIENVLQSDCSFLDGEAILPCCSCY